MKPGKGDVMKFVSLTAALGIISFAIFRLYVG